MSEALPLSLIKTQLPDGRWMISYNGDDIDYDCGTYFLSVMIDGVKWYSEMFTLKDINSAVHPGLIKDTPHCALRFYDNILKQNYYKCKNLCDLPLNPIDHIIPFVIDVSRIPGINVNDITTIIKCYDGQNEYDLSSEFAYIYDPINNVLIHDGRTLQGKLLCGIYYLQLSFGSVAAILYDADFSKWVPFSDPKFPTVPQGLFLQSTYGTVDTVNISREGYDKLRANIIGSPEFDFAIAITFNPPFKILPPGNYKLSLNVEENTSFISITKADENGGGTIAIINDTGLKEYDLVFSVYTFIVISLRHPGTVLLSSLSLANNDVQTGSINLFSEHFKVANITNIQDENIYLYTEPGTETGFEPIVTEPDSQEIKLEL